MRKRLSGIYVVRNRVNGKVYVGLSVDARGRWCTHRGRLRRGVHSNPHLQSAWNRYGEEAFVFEMLEHCGDRSALPALEARWITDLRSANRRYGYNIEKSSRGRGSMSAETKAKISAANKGKVRTPEMRAHMSRVKKGQGKGRVKSSTERENLRAAHAKRSADPDGYSWFRDPENRQVLRENGKKGAAARWGEGGD